MILLLVDTVVETEQSSQAPICPLWIPHVTVNEAALQLAIFALPDCRRVPFGEK